MPHAAFLQRPSRWLRAISRYRASVSGGPNFAYDACVRRVADDDLTGVGLGCWQVAYCGAEPVRAKTMEAFAARFERLGLRRGALRPVYGLAEATLLVTASEHTSAAVNVRHADKRALERGLYVAAADPGETTPLVSCGVPAAGVELVIVDHKTQCPSPPNHIGEIWVSGPSVSAGYYRPTSGGRNPFVDATIAGIHSRWLCTGDLGVVLDGELYVTGRSKDVIILRGRKLHPQDIEHTVEQLGSPQVAGAAAFALDDAAAEGVVLLAELRERNHIDARAGEAYQKYADLIRAEVYREHEVSLAALAFLPPGALARTSSGKLMRFRCKQDFVNAQLPWIARFDAPSHDAGGI
jgi:acyl-CoA synthetase (AMP-forming)/AMP-acid ligase II